MSLPHCPQCNSEYTYEDNGMFICPECAHEWNDAEPAQDSDELIVKDANGNLLADGDSVTVVKDLKVKGSSSMLKIGTKVKNIRLVEGVYTSSSARREAHTSRLVYLYRR